MADAIIRNMKLLRPPLRPDGDDAVFRQRGFSQPVKKQLVVSGKSFHRLTVIP